MPTVRVHPLLLNLGRPWGSQRTTRKFDLGPETPSWSAADVAVSPAAGTQTAAVHVTGHVPCPTTLYHTRTCHHLPTLLMCLYLLGGHLGLLILTYIRSLVWEACCYDSCGRNARNTRPGCVWGRPRAECWVDSPVRLRQPAWTQAPKRALAAATGNEKTPPPLDQRACAKRLKFPDGRGK